MRRPCFFHLRVPAPRPKYRLTETDQTTERSESDGMAAGRGGSGGPDGKRRTEYLDARLQEAPSDWWLLRFLCLRSLKLMDEKGYAGGLVAFGDETFVYRSSSFGDDEDVSFTVCGSRYFGNLAHEM